MLTSSIDDDDGSDLSGQPEIWISFLANQKWIDLDLLRYKTFHSPWF